MTLALLTYDNSDDASMSGTTVSEAPLQYLRTDTCFSLSLWIYRSQNRSPPVSSDFGSDQQGENLSLRQPKVRRSFVCLTLSGSSDALLFPTSSVNRLAAFVSAEM